MQFLFNSNFLTPLKLHKHALTTCNQAYLKIPKNLGGSHCIIQVS